MLTRHPAITERLRNGHELVLRVAEKTATVGTSPVDWSVAQRYVRRLRRGNQPDLASSVVIQYPTRKITLRDELPTPSTPKPIIS